MDAVVAFLFIYILVEVIIHLTMNSSIPTTEAVARRCSVKMVFLQILENSQENACVGISFKQSFEFIKKRLQHRCFPVNFENILRTAIS